MRRVKNKKENMMGAMTKLHEASKAAREQRKAQGLKSTKTPLEKAKENPQSLRLAINAMCFDCQGRDYDPGVRQRIGTCESKECLLNPVRPYQHLDIDNDDSDED